MSNYRPGPPPRRFLYQRAPNSTGSKVAGLAAGGVIVAVFAIVTFFILALVVMGLAFHAAGCATGASCI